MTNKTKKIFLYILWFFIIIIWTVIRFIEPLHSLINNWNQKLIISMSVWVIVSWFLWVIILINANSIDWRTIKKKIKDLSESIEWLNK